MSGPRAKTSEAAPHEAVEDVVRALLRDPHVARGFTARLQQHQRSATGARDTVERVASPAPRIASPLPALRHDPALDHELSRRLQDSRRNKR